MDFFLNNIEIFIPIIAIVADLALGKIPDKYIGYVGIIRRVIGKVAEHKKSGK